MEPNDSEPPEDLPRLTRTEDAELRQLTWFASAGQLSEQSQARLEELKRRDRRGNVRDVRPDPVSRQSEERAFRLDAAAEKTARCANCGFEAQGATLPGFCPGCGQRLSAQ